MARGILLDSSVVIPHLRGTFDISTKVSSDELLFLSLTVLGELYKGMLKSAHPEKSGLMLDKFLRTVALLNPDVDTAMHYARISDNLRRAGKPIPENDIWIAAMAVEYAMPLATRDAHFSHITGLQLLRW